MKHLTIFQSLKCDHRHYRKYTKAAEKIKEKRSKMCAWIGATAFSIPWSIPFSAWDLCVMKLKINRTKWWFERRCKEKWKHNNRFFEIIITVNILIFVVLLVLQSFSPSLNKLILDVCKRNQFNENFQQNVSFNGSFEFALLELH